MNVALESRANRSKYNSGMIALSERALFLLTLLLWSDRILLTYVRAAIMRLPIIGFTADYLIYFVYTVLIIFALPMILRRLRLSDIFFGIIVVFIYLLNYNMFPNNESVLNEYMGVFLFSTFSLYYIGISLDFEKIYPWLYKLSAITIIAFTFYRLFVKVPMSELQSTYQGDMWASYNFLPHVCVVVLAMLKKPSVINAILSGMGVVIIASLGSRGPLLCVLMAAAVYLLLFKKYDNKIFAFFMVMIFAMIIVLCIEPIITFMYDFSKDIGLSVRVFDKFFEGTLSESSGRDWISERLIRKIQEKPFSGYGLFGDRVELGTYAHNVVIELWHSCGVIFGTVILGGIAIVLWRGAVIIKKYEKYALLFIPLFFAGFVKLFLSNSILEEIYFFWLLGVTVNFIRKSPQKMSNKLYESGERSI